MSPYDFISKKVDRLVSKFKTRDPYEICGCLGIYIHFKDLGENLKGFYFYQSKIRNIAINTRLVEDIRRILISHELGHDRLHQRIAKMKGFQEFELYDAVMPTEHEANVFAAELLIKDNELLALLNDSERSFFDVARELSVPAELLDFKFRAFKQKGYRVVAPYIASSGFLKENIDGCFIEEYDYVDLEQ